MKAKVDQEECIGCGTCVALYPKVFEMRDNGKAHAKEKCEDEEKCEKARDSCPVDAISLK